MWLAKQTFSHENGKNGNSAKTICAASGEDFLVGESEYRTLPNCGPYGIYTRPPQGKDILILSGRQGEISLGVVEKSNIDLAAGEILLRSAGGASIYLRNDGKVLINGKEV